MTTSTINASALTGDALLAKVQEVEPCSKSDVARACGYVSLKDDGSERIDFVAFYEAVIEARRANGEFASQENTESVACSDELAGEDIYEISVPIYISINVERKAGLTKSEVLKSITWDDCCDWDMSDISESISYAITKDNDVSVFDEVGDKVA